MNSLSLEKLSSLMVCSIRQASRCAEEQLSKKAMAFIDADSDGTSCICQAETVAFIDRYVAILSKLLHGDAHACLGNPHAPGQFSAVRFAQFPFQQSSASK